MFTRSTLSYALEGNGPMDVGREEKLKPKVG